MTIHDVYGLHDALGHAVVINPSPLTGNEFRFLRQELELSTHALVTIIGRDEQFLMHGEKSETGHVDPVADRRLQIAYHQGKLVGSLAPAFEISAAIEGAADGGC